MSTLRLTSAVLLAAFAVGCSDGGQPAGPDFELVASDAAGRPGDTTIALPAPYPLRHDATAPSLTSYAVTFWAVRGRERSVAVRYQGGQQFLTFTVPSRALDTGLDGRRLAMGDSLEITMRLDPSEFRVDFEPSGLVFNGKAAPTLRVWYGWMNPDVDRDGDVDATDQAIVDSGMTYYHYDSGNINWKKVTSAVDPVARLIEAPVGGFSGYVISW